MVNVITSSRYKVDRKKIISIGDDLLLQHGFEQDRLLNIIFVGRNKMKHISATYKKEPVALPVLSFPYKSKTDGDRLERLVGEIFVCYPQAVLLAAERGKRVDDMIIWLIDHGIQNLAK
jgi:ssRNA-specific RNase YbeY (16S rRNA maturation enzyme)